MKFIGLFAALIMTSAIPAQAASTWAIVVHGGAGVIERKDLSPEQETAYRAAMNSPIFTLVPLPSIKGLRTASAAAK